jgi:hypothetical protein
MPIGLRFRLDAEAVKSYHGFKLLRQFSKIKEGSVEKIAEIQPSR